MDIKKIVNWKKLNKDKSSQYINIINTSPLFDAKWYTETYLNNSEKVELIVNPALHYLSKGYQLGYDPSIYFSTLRYLKKHKDVAKVKFNPLLHFEIHGRKEGRQYYDSIVLSIKKSIFFDESWYKKKYLINSNMDPATHYTYIGEKLGFLPSNTFSDTFYKQKENQIQYSNIQKANHIVKDYKPSLVEFELEGKELGRYYQNFTSIFNHIKNTSKRKNSNMDGKEKSIDDNNIRIFITTNKDSYMPSNRLFSMVQTGSALNSNKFENMYQDNIGDNISTLNPHYCELTGQYWVWKNMCDYEYIGFFHDRRYLSFNKDLNNTHNKYELSMGSIDEYTIDQLGLHEENMIKIIKENDIIVPLAVDFKEADNLVDSSVYGQFKEIDGLPIEAFDYAIEIITQLYPDYIPSMNRYLKSRYAFCLNMYIMKKEILNDYFNWLFPILEKVHERIDYTNFSNYEHRCIGMVAERLFGIFYTYVKENRNYKTCELPFVKFHSLDNPNLIPAFETNNIPVVLLSSNKYAPLLAVTIQSIISNSDRNKNYDLLVIINNFSEQNKRRIKELANGHKNISIRYRNIGNILLNNDVKNVHHINAFSYARLFIPDLFKNYDKVIYLDCDLFVNDDISKLYTIDIDDNLLIAAKDINVAGWSRQKNSKQKKYNEDVLCIEDTFSYFNAGVLVMNLKKLRGKYNIEDMLKIIKSQNWKWMDQDILNALCNNQVKYLDLVWNTTISPYFNFQQLPVFMAPKQLFDEYVLSIKKAKIIHYAGHHVPCFRDEVDYSDLYWKHAKNTKYYYETLVKMKGEKK